MAYRILIVDDSAVMRVMLVDMVESLGHQVAAQADTAAGALKAFKEAKPDLVLLDVSLPDGDGLSVLREIRRASPSARVIMVTGNDQKKIRDQAIALGAKGVLCKPFDIGELTARLSQAGAPARPA